MVDKKSFPHNYIAYPVDCGHTNEKKKKNLLGLFKDERGETDASIICASLNLRTQAKHLHKKSKSDSKYNFKDIKLSFAHHQQHPPPHPTCSSMFSNASENSNQFQISNYDEDQSLKTFTYLF